MSAAPRPLETTDPDEARENPWRRPGAVVGLLHAEIAPDPANPRKQFEPQGLEDLATSVAVEGLLQNLVVRDAPDANGVRMLIAGERRWRAIGIAIERGEWPPDRVIPCLLKRVAEAQASVAAILENLQRVNLDPIEEARAFDGLRLRHQMGTDEIARRIGKTQRFVQQRLQLLLLSEEEREAVAGKRVKVETARRELASRAAGNAAVPLAGTAPRNASLPGAPAIDTPTLLDEIDRRASAGAAFLEEARSGALRKIAEPVVVKPVTRPPSLRIGGAVELLRSVSNFPGAGLTGHAQTGGRWVEGSWVGKRFDDFFADGLIDKPRAPSITEAGREQLAAIDAQLPTPPAPDRDRAGAPAFREAAIADVEQRLAMAQAAAAENKPIAGVVAAQHRELWAPPAAVAFLEQVLEALK